MLKLLSLLLALALLGWGAFMFARNPDNASALQSSSGFIDKGGKFGVQVGDHLRTVDQALQSHHFTYYPRDEFQTCLTHGYPPTQAVLVYQDDSWRRGTTCIAYERASRRVRAIEWAYGPFMVDL